MTEQQRQAAWETVHRPETTAEELTRIGSVYPEFAAAIAAHPNAVSQAPTVYANVVAPAGSPTTARIQGGQLNVFGIIALSLHALHSFTNGFAPLLMSRMAMDFGLSSMNISMLYTVTALAWALLAGGFAIAGTLQKQASRMRWTAVSSLVVSGLALLSIISTFISSLFAPLFY